MVQRELLRYCEGKYKIFTPEIVVVETAEQVDYVAGNCFLEQYQRKHDSTYTLPTGSSPLGMYAFIREQYRKLGLDFSRITVYNLDEYWPLSVTSPFNYASYMHLNLFNHVNIVRHYIPNSDAPDPDEEAVRYEQIVTSQRPDLAIVGIGPGTTCHVGFNERGSFADSRTRHITLDSQTLEANKQYFDGEQSPPTGAITQGIGNILEAEQIILIAKGKGKAWGICRSLEGSISSDAPASFLRLHPRATFIFDQSAASLLQPSTYSIIHI